MIQNQLTASSSIDLGVSVLSFFPVLQWLIGVVLIIFSLYFLIKIGNRLIKLLDLVIEEKKRNRYIANFPSNDDQTK